MLGESVQDPSLEQLVGVEQQGEKSVALCLRWSFLGFRTATTVVCLQSLVDLDAVDKVVEEA